MESFKSRSNEPLPVVPPGIPCHLSFAARLTGFTEQELLNAVENRLVTYYGVACGPYLRVDDIQALSGRPDYGYIYAVGFARYVKIGFTKDIERRLRTLQGGAPLKLEVYRTMRGCVSDERRLHRRFSASRLEREWFFMDRNVASWARGKRD